MTEAPYFPNQSGIHTPVLLREVLETCVPQTGKVIVDATFGAGGYTQEFLLQGARVIGLDRDPTAITAGRKNFSSTNLTLHQTCFGHMHDVIYDPVDVVVMDIGVSSMQIDQAERGFSFQKDALLDMRMGNTDSSSATPSAYDIVNTYDQDTLANIIYYFGDERASRRIASKIVYTRAITPITTTVQLANLVKTCLPHQKPNQIHPATRTFQALRIAVNDELGELFRGLCAAERLLKPGGVLAVVTFHSIEDRIVKRFFQLRSTGSLPSQNNRSRYNYMGHPDTQDIENNRQHSLKILTKRPVTATKAEADSNPRARSAKLRAAQRCANTSVLSPVKLADLDIPALLLSDKLRLI